MNKNKNYDLNFLATLYFINIVLYFITFSWMIILGKGDCQCGKNWKWAYIKYYIIMMFFILCAIVFTFITKIANNTDELFTYVKYGMLLFEIIFVVIVFLNMRDLIKKGCNCQNQENDKIYDSVDVIICILSIVISLILIIIKL